MEEDDDDDSSSIDPIFSAANLKRRKANTVPGDQAAPPQPDEKTIPKLTWPTEPNANGKGWAPKAIPEQAKLVATIHFLKAIEKRDWTAVQRFLRLKLDLNLRDEQGRSALHLAIQRRHEGLVRFLLQRPVDITQVTDTRQTVLHFACAHNDLYLVDWLLYLHKVNGEWDKSIHKCTDDGDNAMHLAAFWGNTRIAKRLIAHGVDFTCKNKLGRTPRDVADDYGFQDFVALIDANIARERQHRTKVEEQLRKLQLESEAKKNAANDSWSKWRKKIGLDVYGTNQTSATKRIRYLDDGLSHSRAYGAAPKRSPPPSPTTLRQMTEQEYNNYFWRGEAYDEKADNAADNAAAEPEQEAPVSSYYFDPDEEFPDGDGPVENDWDYLAEDPDDEEYYADEGESDFFGDNRHVSSVEHVSVEREHASVEHVSVERAEEDVVVFEHETERVHTNTEWFQNEHGFWQQYDVDEQWNGEVELPPSPPPPSSFFSPEA